MHTSPDVLALLALGEHAGTAEERAHVDGCPVCLAEVAELVRVAAVGRSATMSDQLETPRPEVWQAIQAELHLGENIAPAATDGRRPDLSHETVLGLDRPRSAQDEAATVPPVATADVAAASQTSRGRRARSWVLAAAIALVVGFGLGYAVDRFAQPAETVIEKAQLQALPAWPGSKGEAWVERDATGDRFLVVKVDSQRPNQGYRQVWLIDRSVKAMAPMGFLNNGFGRFNIPDDLNLDEFPIVDVSAEPANDPDPAHSGDSIVRGQLAS
jgi:hypothetical protein